ncbi:MAG TPA: hypothetical protein DCQ31_03820 [Bacteroidales bacterium]|nr:hypothetical protein [Bacteroidales bacterium]
MCKLQPNLCIQLKETKVQFFFKTIHIALKIAYQKLHHSRGVGVFIVIFRNKVLYIFQLAILVLA